MSDFMIVLTGKQKDAIPYIEWLINPIEYIGEGRSTALAFAFINVATKHPGTNISFARWVRVTERTYFTQTIIMIMKENYPEIDYKLTISTLELVVCKS